MARLLIFDDDEQIRELFSLEFSDLSHEIIKAGSCNSLMSEIEISQPDLIVLEVKLNSRDGLDMLQEIREAHADMPVIIWSVYDCYRYDLRAIAADYFVTKSLDLTELKTRIDRALEAGAACSWAEQENPIYHAPAAGHHAPHGF